MTILFDAAAPVKFARPARRFGAGILTSHPARPEPYTQADLDWLAEDNARRELDAHYDRLAEEAAALDRLERGLCC